MAASYAYGPDGRRKSRTVNGTTTHGIGEGLGPDLVEWDAATGQLTARTIPGLGPVGAVARLDPAAGTRASLVPDIQGSTIAALASDAAAPATAGYRPFGEGPGVFAIGYTGQRLDAETGLYAMNARAYHPGLGRFVQADPIGLAGGSNLYAYVGNSPLNYVDPSGLVKDGASRYASNSWSAFRDGVSNDYRNFTSHPLEVVEGALNSFPQTRLEGAAVALGAITLEARTTTLAKSMASEAGMAQLSSGGGRAIAGEIRDAPRLVAEYGGEASDWAKVTSDVPGAPAQIHAYKNLVTGVVVEMKSVIP